VRLVAVLLAAVAIAWAGSTAFREDDQPVDPSGAAAREAIAEATRIVPGRLVGVARDTDNGKWEVTIDQDGREYEVELDPATLDLLRLDYD
jgi:Peptidase propeptide and YPEB domain